METEFDGDQFLRLVEGDMELAVSLVDLFSEDSLSLLDQLELAIAAKDTSQVERLAHRIKGSAQNFFATGIVERARTLEGLGHDDQLQGAPALVGELKVLVPQLVNEVRGFIEQKHP